MNKKNIYLIISVIIVFAALFVVKSLFYYGEDGWIKDSDGLWIEHGNPDSIPKEVKSQYDAIICSFVLYSKEKSKNISFNSQCLGNCMDYAVDIVNVPRSNDDDKKENQCQSVINGNMTKFIEIDKNANLIRIVD